MGSAFTLKEITSGWSVNFNRANDLLDSGFLPVAPGNPKIKDLVNHRARYFSLSDLPRMQGICKWCYYQATKTNKQFYCSTECQLSAELFCYPQGIWTRKFLMKRQDDKCAHCPVVFGKSKGDDGFTLWSEIDHIIPIFKGGTALGSENLQLLCGKCHAKKTREEKRD